MKMEDSEALKISRLVHYVYDFLYHAVDHRLWKYMIAKFVIMSSWGHNAWNNSGTFQFPNAAQRSLYHNF